MEAAYIALISVCSILFGILFVMVTDFMSYTGLIKLILSGPVSMGTYFFYGVFHLYPFFLIYSFPLFLSVWLAVSFGSSRAIIRTKDVFPAVILFILPTVIFQYFLSSRDLSFLLIPLLPQSAFALFKAFALHDIALALSAYIFIRRASIKQLGGVESIKEAPGNSSF
jgi:hypothetical protein